MNTLETNLLLWAIGSILLFEILVIIWLCRIRFNRIRPKRFYLKREEYEFLKDIKGSLPSKFQSTILRPPHADELALVGTIRGPNSYLTYNNGIQNFGFYMNDDEQKHPPVSSSSSTSQHWIDLQLPIINTAQLPPADYESHSYPTDTYPYTHSSLPRPTLIDYPQYNDDYTDDDDDQVEHYRYQSIRRPDVTHSQIPRIDTSTETDAVNYSNIVPKSILKSSTNVIPPVDFRSIPYLQTQYSYTSSNYDESPQSSMKITATQSVSFHRPINVIEKRIPIKPISSQNLLLPPKSSMRFASVCQLNDVEWEVTRELQTFACDNRTSCSNSDRTPTSLADSKILKTYPRDIHLFEVDYLSKDDIIQQQAFEY